MNRIGFIRKNILKLITFFQIKCLKFEDEGLYLLFTRLHYRTFFNRSLIKDAIKENKSFRQAQHRHTCMVIDIVYNGNKRLYRPISTAFSKNLLLESRSF